MVYHATISCTVLYAANAGTPRYLSNSHLSTREEGAGSSSEGRGGAAAAVTYTMPFSAAGTAAKGGGNAICGIISR